jgi:hypothetical protein
VPPSKRVADMHYHVSKRNHNLWAQEFYEPGKLKKKVPDNINWLKWYKKLCVYNGKKWVNVKVGSNKKKHQERKRILLNGDWVKSKDGANNLKHFSEATFPHMREGNVFIGFNAISPFEHSVSDVWIKRFLSSAFKSGNHIEWLKTMGNKEKRFSHWENFRREYEMITSQRQNMNNFQWSYLKTGEDLEKHLQHPVIINVVEGGHILQDKYFPHFIDYNLTDSTSEITLRERQKIFDRIKADALNPLNLDLSTIQTRQEISDKQGLSRQERNQQLAESDSSMWRVVDLALLNELYTNIETLKSMDIYMMAIAHLSYNGMVGHAPALDVSKKPLLENLISGFLRRAYGTRVSNDRRYRKAFDGTFYRVPGVNYFGDSVMTRLLHRSTGRIQIDLKHSDPITRKVVLNKYVSLSNMAESEDEKLRPICSHCAVNGLPIDYASPMVNEYQLLKASVVNKFYPFGMNLYNDEVKQIVEQNGIIGIPLEERVLGGYINGKIQWPHCIERNGERYRLDKSVKDKSKRFKYLKKALHYLHQEANPEMMAALSFYQNRLSSDGIASDSTKVLELVCHDYLNTEPFLQNMFHVVDIAFSTNQNKKIDSLYRFSYPIVSENTKSNIAQLQSQYVTPTTKSQISNVLKDSVDVIKEKSWNHLCIGSDLDGLIDPLNVCPTTTNYPLFREKLEVLIPLFLHIRSEFEPDDPFLGRHRGFHDYFDKTNSGFKVTDALDKVFYHNLRSFSSYMIKQRIPK